MTIRVTGHEVHLILYLWAVNLLISKPHLKTPLIFSLLLSKLHAYGRVCSSLALLLLLFFPTTRGWLAVDHCVRDLKTCLEFSIAHTQLARNYSSHHPPIFSSSPLHSYHQPYHPTLKSAIPQRFPTMHDDCGGGWGKIEGWME